MKKIVDIFFLDWINQIYKNLVANIDQGCVGMAFFEWSDEPYTKTAEDQRTMGLVKYEPTIDPVSGNALYQ